MNDIVPRSVLVVAYYFPPMGLSGVQRTLKFVKYLPEYGWHPTVLTMEPVGYFAQDASLLEDLGGRPVEVVRTEAAGPGRLFAKQEVVKLPSERTRKLLSRISDTFFLPDNKIGWRRKAVAKALALHGAKPFDVIFATAPPFTDFLIGADIRARTGLPLVLDYRDPWVEYPFKFYPTPLHVWWNIALERRALKASNHVVTTNRRVKELLIKRHGFLTYSDVEIISQGFDPEDIENAARDRRPLGFPKSDKMRITYAGVFWEDRRPDHFLRALRTLFDERPELTDCIEVLFIGTMRQEHLELIQRLGLTETVTVLGYLPHGETIRYLLSSDLLWVIVGDDVGSPGKTYEYIGARKPILGCVPEGFLKSTILEAGGMAVAPRNVEGIKEALAELYGRFAGGRLTGPQADVVAKYDRRKLAGSLAKSFEALLSVQ